MDGTNSECDRSRGRPSDPEATGPAHTVLMSWRSVVRVVTLIAVGIVVLIVVSLLGSSAIRGQLGFRWSWASFLSLLPVLIFFGILDIVRHRRRRRA